MGLPELRFAPAVPGLVDDVSQARLLHHVEELVDAWPLKSKSITTTEFSASAKAAAKQATSVFPCQAQTT